MALTSAKMPALLRAVLNASPAMHWRETYDARNEGAGFMDRWGCFSLIGDNAPFASQKVRLFFVYMPAGLVYPWHRHPAEEIYQVIAGQAVFKRAGHAPRMLGEGQTMYHASQEIHALETEESPVLCLVAWRNHLTIRPELVPAPSQMKSRARDRRGSQKLVEQD